MNLFCQDCGHEAPQQYRICPACGGRHLLHVQPTGPTKPATRLALPGAGIASFAHAHQLDLYAGFWVRVGAYAVDLLLLFAILLLTVMAIQFSSPELDFDKAEGLFNLVGLFVCWMYYAIQESSAHRATVGKRVLGLRVADEKGLRLGFGRASARFFAKIPSSLLLGIGFLMVAFTERKQGLHDKLTSTVVTRGH